jgi:hypothetical protein
MENRIENIKISSAEDISTVEELFSPFKKTRKVRNEATE